MIQDFKISPMTKMMKTSISFSKITNKKKKSKESKCKWEKKTNLSLKTKSNMLPKKFSEKNLKITKDWKISKLVNGTNLKTCLMSMIEFTLSSTTQKLIRAF